MMIRIKMKMRIKMTLKQKTMKMMMTKTRMMMTIKTVKMIMKSNQMISNRIEWIYRIKDHQMQIVFQKPKIVVEEMTQENTETTRISLRSPQIKLPKYLSIEELQLNKYYSNSSNNNFRHQITSSNSKWWCRQVSIKVNS